MKYKLSFNKLCIYMWCSCWACLWTSKCCTEARTAFGIILHRTSVV